MANGSAAERDTRRLVLDSAAKLFRLHGYAATNLRDIAAAAGMKAGSLYYHFSSKEEIVIEVLNIGVQAVHEEVERSVGALPADAPAVQAFGVAVAAHLRSLLELQDYTSANTRIFGQAPAHVREATMGPRNAYESFWDGLIRRMADEGALRPEVDPRLLRLFLIATLNGTLEWYRPGKLKVEQIAGELSRIVLHGAVCEAAARRP